MAEDEDEKNEAQNVKEILEVISEKIPALLNSLTDVLYGKDSAAKYGQAIAGFYKSLKDSGMTDAQAYELTKTYMSSLNLAGLIGKAMGGHGHDEDDDDDKIGREIRSRIEQKIREKTDEK